MDKFCFTIADCFIFIRNGANIKQDKKKRGYPITRIETTSNNVFNRDKVGYAGIENITPYQDYVLEDGDLLMSHINSLPYLGRVVYYDRKQNETIIHGMNLLRLKAIRTRLHPRYAIFLFSSVRFKNKILAIAKKSVNQASFSINDLKKISIELPTVEQQSHIVNKLVGIQKIIELRCAQLAKLDELVKCRFVEMFAQGFPKITLGNVFETCSGGTPSSKNSDYYDGGNIPWLTSGEVNKGIIYHADSFITLAGLENSSAKWIPVDSVVVAMYGATAGKVGLVKYRTTTNQAVCSILPHADYHPLFLYYAVQQQENWMLSQVVGGAQQNLSQQIVRRMELPSPPYSLQIEFANYASRVDKLRFIVEDNLSFLSLVGAFCIVEVGDKRE